MAHRLLLLRLVRTGPGHSILERVPEAVESLLRIGDAVGVAGEARPERRERPRHLLAGLHHRHTDPADDAPYDAEALDRVVGDRGLLEPSVQPGQGDEIGVGADRIAGGLRLPEEILTGEPGATCDDRPRSGSR